MATQEHRWKRIEQWGFHQGGFVELCLLDLRAKVEALEAAQHTHSEEPDVTPAPAPADGLVERVARVFCEVPLQGNPWSPEARAAIREVAEWLQQRTDTIANGSQWADLLRKEANR